MTGPLMEGAEELQKKPAEVKHKFISREEAINRLTPAVNAGFKRAGFELSESSKKTLMEGLVDVCTGNKSSSTLNFTFPGTKEEAAKFIAGFFAQVDNKNPNGPKYVPIAKIETSGEDNNIAMVFRSAVENATVEFGEAVPKKNT